MNYLFALAFGIGVVAGLRAFTQVFDRIDFVKELLKTVTGKIRK
jgi:hypothetical protein